MRFNEVCIGSVSPLTCECVIHFTQTISPVLMNIKAVKAPNAVVYKNYKPETQQHKEQVSRGHFSCTMLQSYKADNIAQNKL